MTTLDQFFHYRLLDGRVMGSESPFQYANHAGLIHQAQQKHRVSVLLSLNADVVPMTLSGLAHKVVPISGQTVPTLQAIEPVVAMLHEEISMGHNTWCHCSRGTDRTGCIICCLLVTHGLTAQAAVKTVTKQFPRQRQTPDMLTLWQPYVGLIYEFERRWMEGCQ